MARTAIATDSNSGITQSQAKELGVFVLPMPFFMRGKIQFEDIDLTQEQFYEILAEDAAVSTSQPSPGDLMDFWNKILEEYDDIVYIPMSSGLSTSCDTATVLSEDYEGKVQVVNNQRISVTQRQSAIDAKAMADKGMDGEEIKRVLEETKLESSIYITVDTLKYLKKGGRITPAAAALGTLLRIKPVLQIQGEKLDSFSKARTIKQAKSTMITAIEHDIKNRFHDPEAEHTWLQLAYTYDREMAEEFLEEVKAHFPKSVGIHMDPLSLSVACHIGPGAIALACTKKLD